MKSEIYFTSYQRFWEEPEDFEDAVPELPIVGKCPYCHSDLVCEVEDGAEVTFCLNMASERCQYDSNYTEEENRARFVAE